MSLILELLASDNHFGEPQGIGFELRTQSSVVAPNAPKKVDQPHWECGLGD
jgi:hypothetical protein